MAFSIRAALMAWPDERRQELLQELQAFAEKLYQERHMEARDDSRLIWSLVMKQLPPGWDEGKVMDELCLLQYVHQYTNYAARFKSTIPVVKNNLEQQVFADLPNASGRAYEYVQKFVIPLYRIEAMLQQHPDQQFPTTWPWLLPPPQEEEPSSEEEEKDDQECYGYYHEFTADDDEEEEDEHHFEPEDGDEEEEEDEQDHETGDEGDELDDEAAAEEEEQRFRLFQAMMSR